MFACHKAYIGCKAMKHKIINLLTELLADQYETEVTVNVAQDRNNTNANGIYSVCDVGSYSNTDSKGVDRCLTR